MPRHRLRIRSLAFATDVDVLPEGTLLADRGEYVVVRTPSNPTFYWGNFLLFREPPRPGDRERWEALFTREQGEDGERGSSHVALAWDAVEGELGAARDEFLASGYALDEAVALSARPRELRPHARANVDVTVRMLDPRVGAEEAAWDAVVELQVAGRDPGHEEESHRRFLRERMADRRARFRAGDGGWFVAELAGQLAAACGVIVTGTRARYQAVETAERLRRLGIARRLVYEAGCAMLERGDVRELVIVAEAGYHALALYESLGFSVRERSAGVCWWPGAPRASLHPQRG